MLCIPLYAACNIKLHLPLILYPSLIQGWAAENNVMVYFTAITVRLPPPNSTVRKFCLKKKRTFTMFIYRFNSCWGISIKNLLNIP